MLIVTWAAFKGLSKRPFLMIEVKGIRLKEGRNEILRNETIEIVSRWQE